MRTYPTVPPGNHPSVLNDIARGDIIWIDDSLSSAQRHRKGVHGDDEMTLTVALPLWIFPFWHLAEQSARTRSWFGSPSLRLVWFRKEGLRVRLQINYAKAERQARERWRANDYQQARVQIVRKGVRCFAKTMKCSGS